MKDHKSRTIEKWRDYFTFDIADKAHEDINLKQNKKPEELLTELTESDEY